MADTPVPNRSTKNKRSVIKKSIQKHFQDYSEHTSIHGIQYMGDPSRSLIERITWIVLFFISVAACSWMIYSQWWKWQYSPVIVSFAETMTPIYDIPFPAITICSGTKSLEGEFNFTTAFQRRSNITGIERKRFMAMSLTCEYIEEVSMNATLNYDDIMTVFKEIHHPIDTLVTLFSFEGEDLVPENVFKPIITTLGICYTFNMLPNAGFSKTTLFPQDQNNNKESVESDWSLDQGYDKDAGLDAYPNRASGGSYKMILGGNPFNWDAVCTGPSAGYKLILHNPAEMPRVEQDFIRVPLGQELSITIKPSAITTSEGLRSYTPETRKCYLDSERQLRHFSVYTQNNCAAECMLNNTLRICKCTPFHMPQSPGIPVCGHGIQHDCASLLEESILSRKMVRRLMKLMNESASYKDCDCLPGCFDLQYHLETTQASYDFYNLANNLNANDEDTMILNDEGIMFSELNFIFKDSQFISRHRSELYGYTDFLSNCGGLLGLFMGFSVLSLVEIVYYCTIRVGSRFFPGDWGSRKRETEGDETDALPLTSPHEIATEGNAQKGDDDIKKYAV